MRQRPLKHARLVAFGGTRKPGADTASDFNMQALLGAETPVVTLVGKASAYQVRVALETSREENLSMIRESVSHIREQGREVHFDAEHFFDGYREDPDYALQALRTAHRAGAAVPRPLRHQRRRHDLRHPARRGRRARGAARMRGWASTATTTAASPSPTAWPPSRRGSRRCRAASTATASAAATPT